MYYNFRRVHQTLWVTPAVEVKISDHVWTLEGVLDLIAQFSFQLCSVFSCDNIQRGKKQGFFEARRHLMTGVVIIYGKPG
jgi:hypothetical protein